MGQLFFLQFVNNFSTLLLCKIYVFDIFNIVEFFQILLISQSTETFVSYF